MRLYAMLKRDSALSKHMKTVSERTSRITKRAIEIAARPAAISKRARATTSMFGARSRRSAASRQRVAQRLRRSPHLRQVRLVLGVRRVEIGSAEGAILAVVQTHEAPAAAAEAQGDRDAAAFSH